MNIDHSFFRILKPGIPKRYLLFVAAFAWTFAGGMLFARGFLALILFPQLLWLKIICSLAGGVIFYGVLFSNISLRYTQCILNMKIGRPCAFINR